jgi:hypothetical protein
LVFVSLLKKITNNLYSAGSGTCISFWQRRTYLPWFRGERLGFQELSSQLELQDMVAQRVPELNLPVEGAAVRLHLFSAK